MSGPATLGVGLVGLSASGGWAAGAHVPALAAVEGLELRAVVASSPASSRAAAEAHGVPLALDDVASLATHEDIDLVVVSVKVPRHRELIVPALAAGTPVFCEWPLGRDLAEADELTAAAAGIRSFVGLQGRSAPALRYVADLVAEGAIGEVLATTLVAAVAGWGATTTSGGAYLLDRALGATMLTIIVGHALDSVALALGEPTELSATTATRRPEVRDTDTGGLVTKTAEDQVAITGTLPGGAVAAVHVRGGEDPPGGLRWEIQGSEGALHVTSAANLHFGLVDIQVTRPGAAPEPLAVPAAYDHFPALAGQPAHAVAHAYARIRDDLLEGTAEAPDFAHARRHHRLIEAIQRAAATGQAQRLD